MVLAMSLPLALWLVLDTPEGKRGRWRTALAFISVSTPMSLSRSAFFGLAFGGLVILGGWSWKRRRQAAVMLVFYAMAMQVLVPGLLGTVKSLFLNIRNDPSFQGRTNDYSHIGEFIRERPFSAAVRHVPSPTSTSSSTTSTSGSSSRLASSDWVRCSGFSSRGSSARGARRRASDESTRQLGQAFAASIVIAMTSFITFDALSFAMVTGLVFLLLGCCGAIWRLTRERGGAGSASGLDRRDVQQLTTLP